jgi:DNA repair protein RadC
VKHLAPRDRPREKLLRSGAGALGDNELVALVLGSGVRSRSALSVAQDVLALAGGVRGLARIDAGELQRAAGVGVPRAARMLAAIELGRRALSAEIGERPRISSATDAVNYLMPLYGGHAVERMGVLLLDTKSRIIRSDIVSVGSVDASIAHPREVFRAAAAGCAAAVIVFHNHPSGDPMPSADDVALTDRLARAGEVMGIAVADHIILGDGRWFSFRDARRLL